ncbi:hypothetical protein LUZ60_016597 [Juncus effusus]|nr:hypothetical protein LUZ60_016597 [Juncus effusus]
MPTFYPDEALLTPHRSPFHFFQNNLFSVVISSSYKRGLTLHNWSKRNYNKRAEKLKVEERKLNRDSISRMKNISRAQVIRFPVVSSDYEPGISNKEYGDYSAVDKISKISNKENSFARSFHEHVTMGPKLSETIKGKISLGKRLLQAGSMEKLFKQNFTVEKTERLLKASQCYLSTTAGPIAGVLFISNEKIAFRSDKSLTLKSHKGEATRVPYKVLIPLTNVKKAVPSENFNKPEQKFVQIVTVDEFEFWFMGFVNYESSFKNLKQAILEL